MRLTWFCALFLMANLSAAPRLLDVRPLDISGLRLGMGEDEALAELRKRFGAEHIKERRDRSKALREIEIKKNGESWRVFLHFNALENKGNELVVSAIKYYLPKEGDNAQHLRAALLEKYGEPSFTMGDNHWQWCQDVFKNAFNEYCSPEHARLEFHASFSLMLNLENPQYFQAEKQMHEQAKTVTKPSI